MLPQLDSTYFFSQFFWLLVCFCILIIAFRRVFIPRVNALISKRDETVQKGRENIKKLEAEIDTLNQEIKELKNEEVKKSAEIIKSATRKSEKILDEQLSILKNEHEELATGLRKRFSEEAAKLDSDFKIQIDETVQAIFDKLFPNKEAK